MLQDEEYDSDTSDEDFVPEGVAESDDDVVSDGDEEEDAGDGDADTTVKGSKQKRKGKQKKKINGVEKEDEAEKEETKEDKKKEESIWADFLADVEDKPSPPPKPKVSSWGALLGNKKPTTTTTTSTDTTPSKGPSVAKKERNESSSKSEKVKITQVFEFAGEEVRVEKEVDAESVEAQAAKCQASLSSQGPATTKAPPGVGGIKRGGGLSGLVSLLDNKKQKLTTLEKTKLDWNSFKSEEGLDEELEKHKKSKDGYLDKQAFLERADLRQFEIEKAIRMNKRSNR